MHKIAGADHEIDVEAEIALCREHGIDILTEAHAAYPRALREIHDPPGVLFVRGALKPDDALAIGIVGTRHGTQYGLRQAERLAGGLARAGLDDHQRAGPRHRRRRPSRRAGGRRADDRRAGQRRDEHLSARTRQAGRRGRRPGALVSESPPRVAAAGRHVSAAQPASSAACRWA